MNGRKVNLAFLISVILYIGISFGVPILFPALADSLIFSNLFCEMVIVVPGMLFLLFSEKNPLAFLHVKKIKIGTLFGVLLFTVLSMPTITLANLVSQFFVRNEAMAMMEDYGMARMPFLPVLFSVGIFAPFCEELVCRGIYYQGYKKSGSGFKAMLLSALLFALLHMNLNQAAYAFVMGMMAVLLVEATGSFFPAVCYHMLINGSQISLIYGIMKSNPSAYSEAAESLNPEMMTVALSAYLIVAAITLPLAWAVLVWMSHYEGRMGVLAVFWKERKKKEDKLVTVTLILALILCAAMMALPFILKQV